MIDRLTRWCSIIESVCYWKNVILQSICLFLFFSFFLEMNNGIININILHYYCFTISFFDYVNYRDTYSYIFHPSIY